MKRIQVSVPWKEGLHMRPAAEVVKRAMSYESSISLKTKERVADARSIFAVMLLCATLGTVVNIEISGADEAQAIAAMTEVFELESGDEVDGVDRSPG